MDLAAAYVPISFSHLDKFRADISSIKNQLQSNLGSNLLKGLGVLGVATGIGASIGIAVHRAMEAESTMEGLRSSLESASAATDDGNTSFRALAGSIDTASKSAKGITIARDAVIGMKGALQSNQGAIDGNIRAFQNLANAIAQVTAVSKGQVLGLVQSALQHGATAESAQHLATTALGLSKRLGIDSKEALELLARGDDRAMMALGRHSREIAQAHGRQAKLDAINRVAAQGMSMLHSELNTGKGSWEQLQNKIGALYTGFGQLLLPVVKSVIGGLSDLFTWVTTTTKALGIFWASNSAAQNAGGLWAGFGGVTTAVLSSMKGWIDAVVMAFSNWDLTCQSTGISVAMSLVGIFDRAKWLGEQMIIIGEWIFDNWKGIFTDLYNSNRAIFENEVGNIRNLWTALMDWFSGTGFNFKWTGLLDGFQSAIKEAPAFTSLVHSDLYKGLDSQLKQIDKEWDKRAARWANAVKQATPDAKKAMDEVSANLGVTMQDITGKQAKNSNNNSFLGIADAWKKAQESILMGNKDKEQLQETKRMREGIEHIATATQKMAGQKSNATAA